MRAILTCLAKSCSALSVVITIEKIVDNRNSKLMLNYLEIAMFSIDTVYTVDNIYTLWYVCCHFLWTALPFSDSLKSVINRSRARVRYLSATKGQARRKS